MKHFLPILFACVLLCSCGGDEPMSYDKVSGHTYVRSEGVSYPDTLNFLSDGTLANLDTYTWSQEQNVVVIHYSKWNSVLLYLEAFDGKLINWKHEITYKRID